MTTGFVSTMRKGFQMTFANGYTISVQWGAGNYCDNRWPADGDFSWSKDAKSKDAEIAIWKADNPRHFIDPQLFIDAPINSEGDDGVAGWLTPEQVTKIMFNLMNRED